jgi:hypothetical protein
MVNWVNVELYHIDPHLSHDQKARACRVFRINLAADLRPISRRKVCGCAPCSRSLACHLSLSLSLSMSLSLCLSLYVYLSICLSLNMSLFCLCLLSSLLCGGRVVRVLSLLNIVCGVA